MASAVRRIFAVSDALVRRAACCSSWPLQGASVSGGASDAGEADMCERKGNWGATRGLNSRHVRHGSEGGDHPMDGTRAWAGERGPNEDRTESSVNIESLGARSEGVPLGLTARQHTMQGDYRDAAR